MDLLQWQGEEEQATGEAASREPPDQEEIQKKGRAIQADTAVAVQSAPLRVHECLERTERAYATKANDSQECSVEGEYGEAQEREVKFKTSASFTGDENASNSGLDLKDSRRVFQSRSGGVSVDSIRASDVSSLVATFAVGQETSRPPLDERQARPNHRRLGVPRLRLDTLVFSGDAPLSHPSPVRRPSSPAAVPQPQPSPHRAESARALIAHASRVSAAMRLAELRTGSMTTSKRSYRRESIEDASVSRALWRSAERAQRSPAGSSGDRGKRSDTGSLNTLVTRQLSSNSTHGQCSALGFKRTVLAPYGPDQRSSPSDRINSSKAASTAPLAPSSTCSPSTPRFSHPTATSLARCHETKKATGRPGAFGASKSVKSDSAFRTLYDQDQLPLRLHFLQSGAIAVRWVDEDAEKKIKSNDEENRPSGDSKPAKEGGKGFATRAVSTTLVERSSSASSARRNASTSKPAYAFPMRRVSRERSNDGGLSGLEIRGESAATKGAGIHSSRLTACREANPERVGANITANGSTAPSRRQSSRSSSPSGKVPHSSEREPRDGSSSGPVWRRLYQLHLDKLRDAEQDGANWREEVYGSGSSAHSHDCAPSRLTGRSHASGHPVVPRSHLPAPNRAAELLPIVLSGLQETDQPYATLALLASSELLACSAPGFTNACVSELPAIVRSLRALLRSPSQEVALRGLLALRTLATVSDDSDGKGLAQHVLNFATTLLVPLNAHVHGGRATGPELHDAALAALQALEDGVSPREAARMAAGQLIRRYVPTYPRQR